MIIRVKYFNDKIKAYSGAEYTYKTDLDLKPYEKVLAPVANSAEPKRAIVTSINLPTSVISPSWADRVQKIKERDEA